MAKLIDLQNAKQVIQNINNLRDDLVNATPLLNFIEENIIWYERACTQMPNQEEQVLKILEAPISIINAINLSNFDTYPLTAATGSFASISGETRNIIRIERGSNYDLLNEYQQINSTEKQIQQAITILGNIDIDLQSTLGIAKGTYSFWKGGVKTDSDLSKDIRTFQDLFNGFLKKLRAKSIGKMPKDNSWPKMAEAICKSGPGNLQKLKSQQNIDDKLHLIFTETFKRTKKYTKEEFDLFFKEYIEHLLVVLSLIDPKFF
ncbi:MAG: hypothetical protein ACTHMI_10405 [Mucilaginibacter sp.]